MTILVFDSGLGGLSILRELHALLPAQRIVYLADDKGFPYGEWDESRLVARIVEVMARAVDDHQPDLVVVACNTASTLALDALRARFAVPFVGVVPAIKPAAEQTASGLVSVLATQGTIQRQYTRNLVARFADKIQVRLVGSDSLAEIAESYLTEGKVNPEKIKNQIAPCFVKRNNSQTDIVVLACTHYPFLVNQFRKVAPWPVDWLDPAEPIARRALHLLNDGQSDRPAQTDCRQSVDIVQFTSSNPSCSAIRIMAGFGLRTA